MSPVFLINTATIVLLIITLVLVGIVIALYFMGKKAQKRQDEQQAQLDAMKQTVTMLIIDKKRLPVKQSGLPKAVIEQTPKLMRLSKLPVVKARIGSQTMNLVCDDKIFDTIPVMKEVKATVSGIYITSVKALHGTVQAAPEKKKNFFKRLGDTIAEKGGAKSIK